MPRIYATPQLDRFLADVEGRDTSECWPWPYRLDDEGYGRYHDKRAHREVYKRLVGPIPHGITLDHTCHGPECVETQCRHRRCCNPAHLDPVPIKVNLRRAPRQVSTVNAAKTACPQGHPYSAVNSQGRRVCYTCHNERRRAATVARRAERSPA